MRTIILPLARLERGFRGETGWFQPVSPLKPIVSAALKADPLLSQFFVSLWLNSTTMKANTLKVRLILYHKGKILLLKQKRKQGGNYTLVGGNIEEGETAMQALIRECEEEAGILLKVKNLQLAHVLHKKTSKGQRMTLYFKANKWQGNFSNNEPQKFKGVTWFSLENLPNELTSTVRHVINQYRKGNLYSEMF